MDVRLVATLIVVLSAVVLPRCCAGSPVEGGSFRLRGLDSGAVELWSRSGRLLATISGYRIDAARQTTGGVVSSVSGDDGSETLKVVYKTTDEKLSIGGTFTLQQRGAVRIQFDIRCPDDGRPVGGGLLWAPGAGAVKGSYSKLGRWTVSEHGGAPFEAVDGYYRRWSWDDEALFTATEGGHEDYTTESYCDSPPKKLGEGSYVASASMVVTRREAPPVEAAAIANDRPVTLELLLDQPYNLWTSNTRPIPLKFRISNVSGAAQQVTVSYWARDFGGLLVGHGEYSRDIEPGARQTESVSFRAPWKRGIMFAEVRVRVGEHEQFVRTTLSVLPPHRFRRDPNSIFGMAAYWPMPTEEDAMRLMEKLGVRWTRYGDNRVLSRYGIRAMHHVSFPFDQDKDDPAARIEFLKQALSTAGERKNDIIELGNEFNFVGGLQSGSAAGEYTKRWLEPFAGMLREQGSTAKVMCCGLGGPDVAFLRKLHEAGAWDMFDIVSLHTGRGNYTPDYDPPGRGEFWTYLAALRSVKDAVAELGEKPIWITEAYACTLPNHWWYDSLRHCAENALLSYALAIAEGVECMMWYQLNDGVWYDRNGISTTDAEYHFGLLNRDLSLKPSALAYRTAAEVLDGARFVREMKLSDPLNRGLLFETPAGPVAVLWNRAEGYLLTERRDTYVSPEPWVEAWHTRTAVKLPAASPGARVRVLNAIGQETVPAVVNGQIELLLDGAPVVVYGLSADAGQ